MIKENTVLVHIVLADSNPRASKEATRSYFYYIDGHTHTPEEDILLHTRQNDRELIIFLESKYENLACLE